MICEFCKSENIFKRKEKGFAYFDFDSVIFNANFLYVRRDKDNVSLSNLAERGEVQGGKSPSSLNLACVASVSNRVTARKLEREQKKTGGRGRGRTEDQICHARKQSIPGLIDVSSAK